MSNIADEIRRTLRTNYQGSNNDMEKMFFNDNAPLSIGQAYNNAKQYWLATKGFSVGSLEDRDNAYLRSLGYTGARCDMYLQALIANNYFTL